MSADSNSNRPSVRDLFLKALDQPSGAEREAYLEGACGGDAALKAKVEALLKSQRDDGFLDQPAADVLQTKVLPGAAPSEEPGDRIGRYKLLQKIGEGGCGVVYMAEQEEPVRRRVALKVIKLGMDTRSVIARFEAERQALALMDHPNIAKVLDAGATETGRPFFVMELVRGIRITDYCDRNNLSTQERLGLFTQVCRAIQHAHQKGIVHRDIKPSNILVTVSDPGSPGCPKVIDFGIAKATSQQRLTDKTLFTAFEQFIGTPAYMSPEQAEMTSLDVDTRSDIYSLGVLLFELLTGSTPFDTKELLQSGLDAMRKIIREREPMRPSTRLSQTRAAQPAGSGDSALRIPHSALDTDLDWIVMKCLEKDRTRRYETADGLARDIERHLQHEPVAARPPSTVYRAQKFVRRNKVTVIAGAAVAAALVVGVVVSTWQAVRASRLRVRAEANEQKALQAQANEAQQRLAAVNAKQDAVEKLHGSYLAQARANRWSGRAGRRFDSLEALGKAAAIRPSLELRNEAIACLALPDVRVERRIGAGSARVPGGLSFDAAFERYASVSPEGTISIRKTADDRELFSLAGPGNPLAAGVWFSRDGRFLALKYTGIRTNQVLVLDLSQRKVVFSKLVAARSACYRPDSQEWTVFEENGSIWSYDLELGREVWRLQLPPLLQAITYDPLGRRLAVARNQNPTVLIVNVATGEIEQRFDHPAGIGLIAWSRDGAWLACPAADGRTYLRNVATGSLGEVLEGHLAVVTGATFNRVGDVLVTSSWDGTTRFWDPKLGKPLFSLPGGWVGIAFGIEDKLGFGVTDREAGIWQVEAARECRRFGRTGVLCLAQFSPDGHLLAAAANDGVWIWHVEANQLLRRLDAPDSRSVLFLPDGHSLIACGVSGAQLWPLQYTEALTELRVGAARVLCSSFVQDCCLGPGGRTLVAVPGDNRGVMVLDLQKPGAPGRMSDHPITGSITASPDGRWFATGNWQGTNVMVWEMATTRPVKELVVKGVAMALFSPDGQWLVTGSEDEYRLWKVGSWEPGLAVPRDRAGSMFGRMAFSPDGRILALLRGRNSEVKLIAIPGGQELATLDTGPPLCFSSDDGLLATAGEDLRSVFVWDLRLIRQRLAALNLDW